MNVLIGEGNTADKWQYFIIFDLIVFGIGSVVLHLCGLQFTILMCIEPLQPLAGLVMASVGIGWLVAKSRRPPAPEQLE